jgi:hypothetical protein
MIILFVHITEIFQKFIMACKGICPSYVIQKPLMSSRYAAGQKRCTICDVFIKYDGIHCPCCGMMLRTNPRGTNDRARLLLVRQQR